MKCFAGCFAPLSRRPRRSTEEKSALLAKEDIHNLQPEISTNSSNSRKWQEEVEALEEKLRKASQDLIEEREKTLKLQAADNDGRLKAAEEIVKLKGENQGLQKQIQMLTAKLESTLKLQAADNDGRLKAAEEIVKLKGENQGLQKQIQMLTAKLESAQKKEGELRAELKTQEEELLNVQEGYIHLTEEKNTLKDLNSKYEDQVDYLTQELKEAKSIKPILQHQRSRGSITSGSLAKAKAKASTNKGWAK